MSNDDDSMVALYARLSQSPWLAWAISVHCLLINYMNGDRETGNQTFSV